MSKSNTDPCTSWIETADGKRIPNPDATNTAPNPGKSELKRRATQAAAQKPTTKTAKE